MVEPRQCKISLQWNKLNALSTAICVSEQVCIGWRRTGAYYTAKLTFFHNFPVKVWGVCSTSTKIAQRIFKYSDIQYTSLTPDKILNSLLYRTLFYVNIYGSHKLLKTVRVFGPPCTSVHIIFKFLRYLVLVLVVDLYSYSYLY